MWYNSLVKETKKWFGWAYSLKKVKNPEEYEAATLLKAKERFEAKHGYPPVKVRRIVDEDMKSVMLLLGPI